MSVRDMRREAQRLLDIDHFPDISATEYAELLSMDYQAQVLEEVQRRGMKLKDLAERLGVKPAALSRRLTSANLTLKVIAEFALALGLEVEAPQLFDGEQAIIEMDESDAMELDVYSGPSQGFRDSIDAHMLDERNRSQPGYRAELDGPGEMANTWTSRIAPVNGLQGFGFEEVSRSPVEMLGYSEVA